MRLSARLLLLFTANKLTRSDVHRPPPRRFQAPVGKLARAQSDLKRRHPKRSINKQQQGELARDAEKLSESGRPTGKRAPEEKAKGASRPMQL